MRLSELRGDAALWSWYLTRFSLAAQPLYPSLGETPVDLVEAWVYLDTAYKVTGQEETDEEGREEPFHEV